MDWRCALAKGDGVDGTKSPAPAGITESADWRRDGVRLPAE